ncbi:MAG: chemotaxis protein CheW [Mariprofundaceae bacterium]|nr:chemotaxis protein CheW [Mariprofundaceae bacterium]
MMGDTSDDMSSFFQKEAPSDYLETWTQQLAQEKESVKQKNKGAILLKLGQEYMAWSAIACLKILAARPIHSVPHRSHPVFKGFSAMNGNLIPCFSLMRLLNIKTTLPIDQQQVILTGEEHQMSTMLVEHIEGYIRFHDDDILPLPSNFSQTTSCFSQGLLAWHGQYVPLLDEALVLSDFERCMQ